MANLIKTEYASGEMQLLSYKVKMHLCSVKIFINH